MNTRLQTAMTIAVNDLADVHGVNLASFTEKRAFWFTYAVPMLVAGYTRAENIEAFAVIWLGGE